MWSTLNDDLKCLFEANLGEMIIKLLTICTSSCPWARSAVEDPGSRCDS